MIKTLSVKDPIKAPNGNIIALPKIEKKMKKDGTPKIISQNKQTGKKSEVYPFEIADMKNIIGYFSDNKMWTHYLIFVLSCNMARRCGDMLSLRWINFFNPANGKIREDLLAIKEEKTDKLANPHINSACRAAIDVYVKNTGCNVAENGYNNPVFLQLSGTYKGSVLSESGYLKALKKAAVAVGIEYNVGTHSPRKTFGKYSRMLHPGDHDSMELLQTIYNHSDTKTTKHYIGLTKQKIDGYYDDMGLFFDAYVTGDKEYKEVSETPIVSLDINDLRDIVKMAYEAGKNNADTVDAMVHVDAITEIMKLIDTFQK